MLQCVVQSEYELIKVPVQCVSVNYSVVQCVAESCSVTMCCMQSVRAPNLLKSIKVLQQYVTVCCSLL